MRRLLELRADGRIDSGMPVAMEIRPDGRIPIDIISPVAVAQQRPFRGNDDQRIMFRRAPLLVLGEGMPEIRLVGRDRIFRVHRQ